MSRKLTPAEALRSARATAAGTRLALQDAAIDFSNRQGNADAIVALEAAAKKHTNAMHAVGRALKAKRED